MHQRRTPAAHRDGTGSQEGSLTAAEFVGSFPTADFVVSPPLPEVAFVGRSNVGKSSLINALVGRKALARTSKSPGKTRDCNVYRVAETLYLVDLPGYGYARVSKGERRRLGRLIDRYLAEREPLSGVVWLLDVRHDPSPDDQRLGNRLRELGLPVLVVATKGDKLGRGRRAARAREIAGALEIPEDQVLVTSANTRDGIDDLTESILALGSETA